ncbi:argininosuccinate synthase [Candidatus Aerophobetes bacterium]|uniref:Argininosuccinate synthase n=1 Tax=Aerophobetes bacterium TaxID=2030807 RepID=A0A662DJ36_UNCAE|nr:MAG: argininosuccinate synthase [Candidatus Aerophobetes bacterium]
MEKIKKIVLAYSGGLDTSVILHWLKEKYSAQVITFTANLGQGELLEKIKEKAEKTGANKAYINDLREEFAYNYILPALKAGALYEDKYPLATALARPLIAKELVKIAQKEGADAIAHGCTGKGNDQVRFEVTAKAIDPDIEVIAPVRQWEFKSREEEIEYARNKGIPVEIKKSSPYSIDRNIWGVSIECGPLEDPWQEPPEDRYQITKDPQKAPSKPTYIEIEFKEGCPVAIDGKDYNLVRLIEILNEVGGENGVGRIDMVENRLVGIKSREVYEAPAAIILHRSHQYLEDLTLDRETLHFKPFIAQKYAELIYNGLWYSPLREAMDSFISTTQKWVTGKVKVKLFKGSCQVVGRKSVYSLYDMKLATYSKEDIFDQKSSSGFIHIWGLPIVSLTRIRKSK